MASKKIGEALQHASQLVYGKRDQHGVHLCSLGDALRTGAHAQGLSFEDLHAELYRRGVPSDPVPHPKLGKGRYQHPIDAWEADATREQVLAVLRGE